MADDQLTDRREPGKPQTFQVVDERVQPLNIHGRTLAEASAQLPPGVYTTFRTYGGDRVIDFQDHLVRLEESTKLLAGRPLDLRTDEMRSALRQALEQAGYTESRVRITAARGRGDELPRVFISLEPLVVPPPEAYEQGVHLVTAPALREEPRAKSTAFIGPSRRLLAAQPSEVYEVLMVDPEGRLLECLTANFVAILNGQVRTAGEGVLEGVTRRIVLDLASRLLPVRLEAVRLADLPALGEAFITSSSREIVPAVRIDDQTIGDGQPGPVTRQLLGLYREQVRRRAEPI